MAVLLFVLSAITAGAPRAAEPAVYVSASGDKLMLGTKEWRAVGFNFWDMDAARVVAGDWGGCYYQHTDLDAYFESSFRRISMETGATAVRTFAFLQQYTGGSNPDWSSTDKLLHYARMFNVRVIPVLGEQAGNCGDVFKTPAWYHCPPAQPGCTPGYKQPGPWGVSYRDYVVSVVARYKDDPTIAFWQLMNEAYVAGGGASDPTALSDFAADMLQAVRVEAGDTNHLVSLGTRGGSAGTGSQLEPYRRLMDCPTPCIDIANAHYYGAEALQGMPAQTTLTAEIVADTDNAMRGVKTDTEGRFLMVDGWRTVQAAICDPRTQTCADERTWGIKIKGAAAMPWSVQLDRVVVVSAAGPRLYEFEAGDDGFAAQGVVALSQNVGSVKQTAGDADSGAGSLRIGVADPAAGLMVITAPRLEARLLSVSLRLRVNFTAPLAQPPDPLALSTYLREATAVRNVPFVQTELGAWQEIIPFSPDGHTPSAQSLCAQRAVDAVQASRVPYSAPHRALLIDAMLALQFNEDHASSGALVWDWKDPAALVTRADGLKAVDPMINCFTVVPGDPSELVIMKWASMRESPAITGPVRALDPPSRRLTGLPMVTTVKAGAAFAVKARVTSGGSPLGGVSIATTGDCVKSAATDALGHGSVVCRIDAIGTYSITVAGNGSCACAGSRTYTITVVP